MKHNPTVMANAAGATTAIVYIICRLLVGLFPGSMINIANSWFHSYEITTGARWNLTTGSFFLGIVTATITAWLIGFLFAKLYNYFLKS